MGSIERREDATELRFDYAEVAAGELVIVIKTVPTSPSDAGGSAGVISHEAPSRPLSDAVRPISEAAAYAPILTRSLVRAAWRGQDARASELAAATIEDAATEDEPRARAIADYARAVLYNGLGRYHEAFVAAERACKHETIGACPWALLELVEAATRSGARTIAFEALQRIADLTRINGASWLLGVRSRSAALLSEGEQADSLYLEAIQVLGKSEITTHVARAQLIYGEWLRRDKRRIEARTHLRAAHETLIRLGAEAFAERAYRELLATGETARKRTDDTRGTLTPQEAQIARLAQEGLTNPEIGAQLFLSPRTVQYHLRKVFQKLNITSRNQLGRIALDQLAA